MGDIKNQEVKYEKSNSYAEKLLLLTLARLRLKQSTDLCWIDGGRSAAPLHGSRLLRLYFQIAPLTGFLLGLMWDNCSV